MAISFSQKEKTLLQDQKDHEDICIQKYTNYASQAQDPQLKQIFNSLAGQEQQHYNSINQMLNGQVPNMNQQQGQQAGSQAQPATGTQSGMKNQQDGALCTDMLMTEKYVSGAYDSAIFEFKDPNVRQTLNHIQKEEQQHGEQIFGYMQNHGMYSAQ